MSVHHGDLPGAKPVPPPAVYPAKHPLPASNLPDFAGDVVVFTPSAAHLDRLIATASADLAALASRDAVARVVNHNPDALWGITRRATYRADDPTPEGFIAFLMLNTEGLRQLIAGTFDASAPDTDLLCGQHQRPAGVYIWAMWARNNLVAGIPLAIEKTFSPLYKDADLFARAVTQDGKRLLETMGFLPGASFEGETNHGLHCLVRSPRQARAATPLYDRYHGDGVAGEVAITVARSIEDMMKIIALRSAVYIAEQECPYLEEFDGNDFSCTHLLAYLGNEPIGCLRIRFFADFAKIERLAVRKEFRNIGASRPLVEAAIDLCKAKGYQRMYGHAARHVVKFWEQFGFSVVENAKEFVFSDFEYIEMQMFTERRPTAVTIGIDPYLTIRPEGQWHKPGILERSSARPVTTPSVGGGRRSRRQPAA
jgi:predicted GNAT family N-acyltransferase